MTLVVVDAPHFYAGMEMDEAGIIQRAAPILGWAVGKHRDYLRRYFAQKGWRVFIHAALP